jgi:RND family efflux transporter MFP subunit
MRRLENLRRGVAFSQKRFDDVTQELAVRKGQRDERQAQLAQATEQLNRANIDLRDADIRAPYDGVVTERHVDVGVWLSNSTPVVTLFNDREVEVEADVPSDRIVGLAVGDEVRLSLDDGTIHGAVLRAIVPVENPLTRTRAVRFTPKFGTTLKAPALNQSVTVAIAIGGSRRVLTVLKDAILRPDGQPTVFVVEGNTVQPRIVVLGESAGNRFIVLKGLKAGDRAVYRGNEQLQAGQRVRIVENGDGDTAARTN